MVGAGGFSSSGTARRSENPVSERVAVCSTLFSEEDKGRIDCSPLKGCAAQPCLPAAAHGHAEVQAPHLSGTRAAHHLWHSMGSHYGLSVQDVVILTK